MTLAAEGASELNSEHFQRAGEVFEIARHLEGDELSACLDRECREDHDLRQTVEDLLAAHSANTTFLAGELGALEFLEETMGATDEEGPESIGPYQILETVGEGGMGTVYRAEQRKPIQRIVALKVIKAGLDSKEVLARFEAERQALALMSHPAIAKVHEAGTTVDGRPYFSMEFVPGVPIDDYCDEHRIDLQGRLTLFLDVCDAVQHAHQKGIIHRDLKPSNVLVHDGDHGHVVKVIDFGIAKATTQQLTERTLLTSLGQVVGTPEYMSPEQAGMAPEGVDIRSDVYSLGVLLYELLVGELPFDTKSLREAGYLEVLRIVREVDPPKPSTRLATSRAETRVLAEERGTDPGTLVKRVRGDLDWITMKALEKDPAQRYATVAALREDLRRHLAHEPIEAGPPSRLYRLKKFARRHRVGMSVSLMLIVVTLFGFVGTIYGLLQAQDALGEAKKQKSIAEAALRAEQEARADEAKRIEELELVTHFQSRQLSEIDVKQMGQWIREGLLEKYAAAARRSGRPEDQIAAEVTQLFESVVDIDFTGLALTALQEGVLARAVKTAENDLADQPIVQARILQATATTTRALGLLHEATDPQEKAVALNREHLGVEHPDTQYSIMALGILLQQQGDFAGAEARLREALEIRLEHLEEDDLLTFRSMKHVGHVLIAQGKLEDAEAVLRQALAGLERTVGADDPESLSCMINLGGALSEQRKLGESEALHRELLERSRRVLGEEHADTVQVTHNLAIVLGMKGDLKGAAKYHEQTLELSRRLFGDDHFRTASSMNAMASVLLRDGRLADAERYYREVIAWCRRVLGDEHPNTLTSIASFADTLRQQGKLAEAEECYEERLDAMRRLRGEEHPLTIQAIHDIGLLRADQGRLDEAAKRYHESLDLSRRVLGNEHSETLRQLNNYADVLRKLGRLEEAIENADEAVEIGQRTLGKTHWKLALVLDKRGLILRKLERYAEATEDFEAAYSIFLDTYGSEHPRTARAVERLASCYQEWHESEPGAGHDRSATEWKSKLPAPKSTADTE